MPRNIYGTTKTAAESLCALFHRRHGLNCIVLRTSRFFPEEDDNPEMRARYPGDNAKANEFLFRRVDIADAVQAHLCAMERASDIGHGLYVISATPPFTKGDLVGLRENPGAILDRLYPDWRAIYATHGYRMFDDISRVYSNALARQDLGWVPAFDFRRILDQLKAGDGIGSTLARMVGVKGYHDQTFTEGPYPTESP